MPLGVALEDFFEVAVEVGGQVELLPDECGREEILFGGEGMPDVPFLECGFDEGGVVAGVDYVTVRIAVGLAFTHPIAC